MKINKIIENPLIYYKLDPGEPGLATPSLASNSIARVASHEMGNIMRFKKMASDKGGIVVYSFIGLNLKFVGSFLAATAGVSEALIIYPAKKEEKNIINFDDENKNENEKLINPDDINNIDKLNLELNIDSAKKNNINKNISEINDSTISKINEKIKELENEMISLSSGLKTDNLNINIKNSPENETRIDKIETKIRILEAQKDIERQKQILDRIAKMNTETLKIIGLNFKNSLNSIGKTIDTIA